MLRTFFVITRTFYWITSNNREEEMKCALSWIRRVKYLKMLINCADFCIFLSVRNISPPLPAASISSFPRKFWWYSSAFQILISSEWWKSQDKVKQSKSSIKITKREDSVGAVQNNPILLATCADPSKYVGCRGDEMCFYLALGSWAVLIQPISRDPSVQHV